MDEELLNQVDDLNRKNMELLTSFSPAAMIGAVIFGLIGFYLFRHGKKTPHHRLMVIGIILMIYPLFFTEALHTWAIGCALTGLAYYWRHNG